MNSAPARSPKEILASIELNRYQKHQLWIAMQEDAEAAVYLLSAYAEIPADEATSVLDHWRNPPAEVRQATDIVEVKADEVKVHTLREFVEARNLNVDVNLYFVRAGNEFFVSHAIEHDGVAEFSDQYHRRYPVTGVDQIWEVRPRAA